MALDKHQSIFPQIHLPGGISSKATEYKDLATKGDNWESPIFKIGSAGVSKDIEHAPNVTQKPHAVTEGGVRGPQNIGNTSSTTENLKDPSAQRDVQSGGLGSSNAGYSSNTTGLSSTSNGYTKGSATDNTSFGTQVDNALNGSHNGNGIPTSNAKPVGTTGTTFGANNPVFNGSA